MTSFLVSEFAASFPTLSEAADFTKKSETFRHGLTLNYALINNYS